MRFTDILQGIKMEDTVWVSNVVNDLKCYRAFENHMSENDENTLIMEGRRNDRGEPLTQDSFPDKIWHDKAKRGPIKKLPAFFCDRTYWVANEKVTEILRQFDLGEGNLYPVELFQKDKITPIEGGYHYLNFGNVKHSFLPDESPETMQMNSKKCLPFVPKDGDVAVNETAFIGPDIWIDPELLYSFFVSGRLVQALKKAKLDKFFRLSQCRIVSANDNDQRSAA